MKIKGFLGIDAGTQGLSVVFSDEQLQVLETGNGDYAMVSGLAEGCYEQQPADWEAALQQAMRDLRSRLRERATDIEILAIGISGQMHGEVLVDRDNRVLGPARLWCDSRNEDESVELTQKFGVKMPKRITGARWLWTTRHRPDLAKQTARLTTPGGWLAFRLTAQWNLGIGDASGMFPIDQQTLDYSADLLKRFDGLVSTDFPRLGKLLPTVRRAGEDAGSLGADGATLLGLPAGIPVASAEGDQPAALAGSLIGRAGVVSASFGTSVCANSVGDRVFQGVSTAIDHFCAVDGKPINMVWLRNGTTFMNAIIQMFSHPHDVQKGDAFSRVIPQVLAARPDCGGVIGWPFMDDEPGLGVPRGGTGMLIGLNAVNATPGNIAKAALLSTMFNLRKGSEILDRQGYPRHEIVLTGGLTKTPELGQVLADVFRSPVSILNSASEGSAWGAAVLASYRHAILVGSSLTWEDFLDEIPKGSETRFTPDPSVHEAYQKVYEKYTKLLSIQGVVQAAV